MKPVIKSLLMIGLPILVVAIAAIALISARHGAAEETVREATGTVSASVIEVRRRPTTVTEAVPGTVMAVRHAELSPKVMGRIADIYVDEGDHVVAGQLLARLEGNDLAANVLQAQAGVQNAEAAYQQAKTGLVMQKTQSSVAVQQAQAALDAARAQLAKAKQGPRPEQVRQAEENAKIAAAAVEQAKAQLEKAKQGPRPEQVAQADENVKRAKAGLEQAQAMLNLAKEGARAQQKRQAEQGVLVAEQQVDQAVAGLATAQANLRTVQTDFNRITALVEQDILPRQKLDYATLQLESAKQGVRAATAAVNQANAGLEIAKDNASMAREGARSQEIIAAEKQVEQAQSGYEQAVQEAKMAHQGGRWEDIKTAQEAVNQAQAAAAQANAEVTMARQGGRWEDVKAAEEGVRQAQAGLHAAIAARARDQVSEKDVTRAAAGISQAKAGLTGAQVMHGYTAIYAPFSGVITARKADPGNMAMPQMPILALDDDAVYQLVSQVPERLAAKLSKGIRVMARLDALDQSLPATISEIVPAADPASRTLTVKANLPKAPGVQSGLFGRLTIAMGRERQLTIPETAVVERNGLTGVFVVDTDGTALYTLVTLGKARDGRIPVLSGLEDRQRIVATGVKTIRAGQRIRAEGGAK